MREIDGIVAEAGFTLLDYQVDALRLAQDLLPKGQERLCLYHRTGAGKTLTALLALRQWGHDAALVVAPPSTHAQWVAAGLSVGVKITPMSHAKFRMKDTKVSRHIPIVADEFHLFGGHTGQGWKKLDRVARHLQAPLVLASATPNYNDAERVYCIQHILDPAGTAGGYLAFVYQNCTTEANMFGMLPNVTGFRNYPDAAAYLADMPNVAYLPDNLVYTIIDIPVRAPVFDELEIYGMNRRAGRILASQMEERHARVNLGLIGDDDRLASNVFREILKICRQADGPVLIFCNHSTVAEALGRSLEAETEMPYMVVTGDTPKKMRELAMARFSGHALDILVGTATLATGTDGMDKVCDTLIILDDTDDESLRRQLIGRIMPRGVLAQTHNKQVYRMVLT